MIFPSDKKKELWRYASENNPATGDGPPSQPPRPRHPPHPRRPQAQCYSQLHQYQQQQSVEEGPLARLCCCRVIASDSEATTEEASQRSCHLHTPPPPYRSVASGIGNDCSGIGTPQTPSARMSFRQRLPTYATDCETETTTSTTEESDTTRDYPQLDDYTKNGCSYGSSGEDMLIDEADLSAIDERSYQCYNRSYYGRVTPTLVACPEKSAQTTAPTLAAPSSTPTNFATTAANMFRNCCGGGFLMSSPTVAEVEEQQQQQQRTATTNPTLTNASCVTECALRNNNKWCTTTASTVTQDFNALMKQLKHKQYAELLRAVKSRKSASTACTRTPATSVAVVAAAASVANYSQCILIKRSAATDEVQYTACRLFFWNDLRNAAELKRLPVCPSEYDRVYVCCNPLHSCRIFEIESAPPPYRRPKMQRLKNTCAEENSQSIRKTNIGVVTQSSPSNSIGKPIQTGLYARIPESFTTDDDDDRKACSTIWCQIAYWELAQRVGPFHRAKKPSINIYSDGAVGNVGENMCLKDLMQKQQSTATDAVQQTRQKIGLGVTLQLDVDGVWVYNRATVPIFVDSPTLCERLDRVCKVMPGYCLKAFDTHRVKHFNSAQFCAVGGHQFGPIDPFSIKISFAKGWGHSYRRQDIMGCPCWLEVHYSQRR